MCFGEIDFVRCRSVKVANWFCELCIVLHSNAGACGASVYNAGKCVCVHASFNHANSNLEQAADRQLQSALSGQRQFSVIVQPRMLSLSRSLSLYIHISLSLSLSLSLFVSLCGRSVAVKQFEEIHCPCTVKTHCPCCHYSRHRRARIVAKVSRMLSAPAVHCPIVSRRGCHC